MSMSTPARPELLIVIPVHEEDGWSTGSPAESVKARLSAPPKSPKTPEDIKAADEKAQVLREIHLEAVRARAQRDLERVQEAERRRLRAEAFEKQKILERAAEHEKKQMGKKEALEAQAAEKRAHREALREAFFANRMSMAAATRQRESQRAEAMRSAQAKRNKALQATVHRANYEVKHALAVATAAKEKERLTTATMASSLDEKLAAASSRRLELLGTPKPSSLLTSPTGSSTSAASEPCLRAAKLPTTTRSSRERAKQVALLLNDEAVSLERKRVALACAMDKALAARDANLAATVQRASAYKERAARAKEALEARRASVDELAHQIVDKAQTAAVNRSLHLLPPALKKRVACAFDIEVGKRAGALAPTALIARLGRKPTLLLSELNARLMGATARRERLAFTRRTRLAERNERAEKAACRRAATAAARQAKLAAAEAAAAERIGAVKAVKAATALVASERHRSAEAKRTAARALALNGLVAKANKCEAAAARRTALLTSVGTQRQRAAAVVVKRAAFDAALVARGEAMAARVAAAAARRAALLSARVARAKMSGFVSSTAVKLTAGEDGRVRVHVVTPGEKTPLLDEDAPGAPAHEPPAKPELEPKPVRGLIGRLFGRIFGV